jgi:hypothetical protein
VRESVIDSINISHNTATPSLTRRLLPRSSSDDKLKLIGRFLFVNTLPVSSVLIGVRNRMIARIV